MFRLAQAIKQGSASEVRQTDEQTGEQAGRQTD